MKKKNIIARKRKAATYKMYVENNGRDGCTLDFYHFVIFLLFIMLSFKKILLAGFWPLTEQ